MLIYKHFAVILFRIHFLLTGFTVELKAHTLCSHRYIMHYMIYRSPLRSTNKITELKLFNHNRSVSKQLRGFGQEISAIRLRKLKKKKFNKIILIFLFRTFLPENKWSGMQEFQRRERERNNWQGIEPNGGKYIFCCFFFTYLKLGLINFKKIIINFILEIVIFK